MRGKSSVSIAQQNRNRAITGRVFICDGQVGVPVPIEVCNSNTNWITPGRWSRCGLSKGAVSMPQEYRHRVAVGVGYRQIDIAVVVKVAGSYFAEFGGG